MSMVKLLDCTLREAPLVSVGKDNIIKTIANLEAANIDFLECAFLCSNIDYEDGSAHFNSVEQIEEYLQYKKPGICYTACTQWPDYDINMLSKFNGKSVDGIRYVLKKGQLDQAVEALNVIMQKGYKAFLQNADSISFTEEEIVEVINKVNEIKPYAYSISDTYGAMYLEDVRHLFEIVDKCLDRDILFGFHSHNNLLMANANAQEFLSLCTASGRDGFIDSSVWGCGIGAGNAKTELAVPYLNRIYGKKYDLDPILLIIDEVIPDIEKRCSWGYKVPTFLSGVTNAVTTHADFLANHYKHLMSEDILKIINTMSAKERKNNNMEITQSKYQTFVEKQLNKLSSTLDKKKIRKMKYGLQKTKLKKNIMQNIMQLRDTHPKLFQILRTLRGNFIVKRIFRI